MVGMIKKGCSFVAVSHDGPIDRSLERNRS